MIDATEAVTATVTDGLGNELPSDQESQDPWDGTLEVYWTATGTASVQADVNTVTVYDENGEPIHTVVVAIP